MGGVALLLQELGGRGSGAEAPTLQGLCALSCATLHVSGLRTHASNVESTFAKASAVLCYPDVGIQP